MRRSVSIGLSGLLILGAVGCGGSKEAKKGHSDPVIGSPVPTPSSTAAPKVIGSSPSTDAPFLSRIKYRLEAGTVAMAGSPAKTSVTCDKSSLPVVNGATVHCTVDYAGLAVPWTVTIKGSSSDVLVPYDATPSTGLVTRAGVLRAFYTSKVEYGTDLRCGDLPDKALVPLGRRSQYRCQYVSKPDKSLKLGPQRITFAVISKQRGPDFELPYDVH